MPFDFAVSGMPSPFLLVSGSFVMSVECLVSAFDNPSCFPDWVFMLPAGLDAAGYGFKESVRFLVVCDG